MSLRPIEELITELDTYTGFTKYDLVDEAVERRDEITPRLLDILRQMLADPDAWIEEEHDITNYVMVLLCHFREETAHPLLLELFSLPGKTTFGLFGDLIGETLHTLLLNTCNGSLDGIKNLVVNRDASSYCRWSACTALGHAVALEMAERDEIVSFLKSLFTGDEAKPGDFFWNGLVDTLVNLHPRDALEEIHGAYDAGLVQDDFAPISYIEEAASSDLEQTLKEFRIETVTSIPGNINEYMNWWDEPGREVDWADSDVFDEFGDGGPDVAVLNAGKKQKEKRRKNNKAAKKARRKNR